jgi:hypothetical protein
MNTHEHGLDDVARGTRGVTRQEEDPAWQGARRAAAQGHLRSVEPTAVLRLQRLAGNAGTASLVDQEPEATSPVLDVVGRGGGSPLPTPVRVQMESGLGADFSDVRIHDDAKAAASAQAVQAHAYTVGNDVVFNSGAYAPDTEAGRHTLAHELSHVVQQRSGPVDGTSTGDGIAVSDPQDRFEQHAERAATAFDHHSTAASGSARAAGVQRTGTEGTGAAVQTIAQREEMPEEEPEELPTQAMALQREANDELEEEAE